MGDCELSMEQCLILRRLEIDARQMSRAELVAALCHSWEARFQMKNVVHEFCRCNGIGFRLEETSSLSLPESAEDLVRVFGYVPSEQEAEDYVRGLVEAATMELDMDEIVLMPDDGVL